MAIQKKSLISTLKTTKKANVAKEEFSAATNDGVATRKSAAKKSMIVKHRKIERMARPVG